MSNRRVVVTGVGMVTPVGLDTESSFESMLAGRSGAGVISHFDPEGYSTRIACEVKGFDPTTFLSSKQARKLDRFTTMGLKAGKEAWEDSGLDINSLDAETVGCIGGSGIGGLQSIEDQHKILLDRGPGRVTPFLIPKLMMNALSGELSMLLGLKGPNWVTASACSSSSHAIGTALRLIQGGEADIILTGGSEAAITPLGVAGFCSLRAMSSRNDDPEAASRPFDKDRDGFVIGEGSAFLVLETYEHAQKRGAKVYCELAGFGATADAFHITAPAENAEGAQRSMKIALKDAGLQTTDVTYVNAHGTSTPINDVNETAAINAVFGAHAKSLVVSSTKSMIGHLLGGSGAVGAAVCALSISRGVVHQTLNHENPGEGCNLDYIKEGPREMDVAACIANSLGFGGHNCTLAFNKI